MSEDGRRAPPEGSTPRQTLQANCCQCRWGFLAILRQSAEFAFSLGMVFLDLGTRPALDRPMERASVRSRSTAVRQLKPAQHLSGFAAKPSQERWREMARSPSEVWIKKAGSEVKFHNSGECTLLHLEESRQARISAFQISPVPTGPERGGFVNMLTGAPAYGLSAL